MRSIEKLREMMDYVREPGCNKDMPGAVWVRIDTMQQYADEIEAEITERHIEQPFDRDGVPIKVGETCYDTDTGEPFEVSSIEWNGICWSAWSKPETRHIYNHISHKKPRTIEDVLRDVWKEAIDYAKSDIWRNPDEVFAERADEIRKVVGE